MTRKYGIDPNDEFNRKHRKRRPPKKFDNNPQTVHHFSRTEHYRSIFRQVMDQLIVEYKQISMSIDSNVQSLSKLSPKYIINFTKNDATDICNMLQIDDCNLLFNEVQLLKMKICEFETINLANKFVHERKLYVPLLAQAYEYLLTLPVSVASVERSFSKMKIVKNRLRTKMNDDRLHSLLTCTIETSIVDQIDNKKLAQKIKYSMAQLQVKVVEGRNLKKQDLFSENDAYVELYLDNKKRKQKTSIKYDQKTPVWNESFTFNHLKGQDILHVGVYDKDLIFDDKIGRIKINLQELYQKGHIDHWYDLPSKFGGSSHGQIHLILDYQPLRF